MLHSKQNMDIVQRYLQKKSKCIWMFNTDEKKSKMLLVITLVATTVCLHLSWKKNMVCMWGKAHPCPCELSWVQPVLRSWLPVVSELSPATGREKSQSRWKEERSKCRRAEKEETEGERGRRGRLLAWQSLLLKHKLHTAQTCVCHMAVIPPLPPCSHAMWKKNKTNRMHT